MRSLPVHKAVFIILFIALQQCISAQVNSARKIFSLPDESSGVNNYDSLPKLKLRHVIITGNKKTKDYIILREMELKPGDSIPIVYFLDLMEKDRQHIYNTTLFATVTIEPLLINAFDFDIYITVKERWYIYPLPELKFVDGNLNKWLMHYKGDLHKVNYGIKFKHYNLTGRKDQLAIHLLNGYTKTVSLEYKAPYANPDLTNGFSIGGSFIESREVAYKTSYDNDLLFFKKNEIVKRGWEINLGYSIRRGLKLTHQFNINYSRLHVDDSVITNQYNKSYFNKPTNKAGFIDLVYKLKYVDLNNVLYPLKGVSSSFSLGKRGAGISGAINSFFIDAEFNKYWMLGDKWYASTQLQGNVKFPFRQPYINQQAMGYQNNYVRGYEYKVIDGVAYAISRFDLKKQILDFNINTIFKKSKTLNRIPVRIYAKAFGDMGVCYNKDEFVSKLNNRFLGSAGLGIDIVTLYDIQIRLEYSINQLGQKGLFLHNEKGF